MCFSGQKKNPHIFEEIVPNPPHVMVWAGMTAEHLLGPYFFDGPVNENSYLSMIWLLPQLTVKGIAGTVWFQQDGYS